MENLSIIPCHLISLLCIDLKDILKEKSINVYKKILPIRLTVGYLIGMEKYKSL